LRASTVTRTERVATASAVTSTTPAVTEGVAVSRASTSTLRAYEDPEEPGAAPRRTPECECYLPYRPTVEVLDEMLRSVRDDMRDTESGGITGFLYPDDSDGPPWA
jgi:hypothetical protein